MAVSQATRKRRKPALTRRAFYRELAGRLQRAAEGFNIKEVSDLTGFNAENTRRHLGHGRAPAYFLAEFATVFEVEAQWLLLGKGPMRRGKRTRSL